MRSVCGTDAMGPRREAAFAAVGGAIGALFGGACIHAAVLAEPAHNSVQNTPRESAGPAERLGARIDSATECVWGWLKGHSASAESGLNDAEARVGQWWESERETVWGNPAARQPAELFLAMNVPVGPRDPSKPGGEMPLVWRRLGGDSSAVGGDRGLPLPKRLVLLVHGLDEPGGMWDDLAPALFETGLCVAKFDYPNDQHIAESTDMLAGVMRGLRSRGVERVDIVAHSMGGLVARDLLTRDAYYNADASGREAFPRVERLIVLSAPYAGSVLAPLEPLGEAREHLTRHIEGSERRGDGWLHSYADGNGEAGIDLTPGSAFLKALDSRPDPRGVTITNVVATIIPQEYEHEAAAFADAVKKHMGLCDDGAWGRAICQALGTLGDGMVCRDSAGWACAADTVRVNADHRGMIQRWRWLDTIDPEYRRHPRVPPAIPIILDRLSRSTDSN